MGNKLKKFKFSWIQPKTYRNVYQYIYFESQEAAEEHAKWFEQESGVKITVQPAIQ